MGLQVLKLVFLSWSVGRFAYLLVSFYFGSFVGHESYIAYSFNPCHPDASVCIFSWPSQAESAAGEVEESTTTTSTTTSTTSLAKQLQ